MNNLIYFKFKLNRKVFFPLMHPRNCSIHKYTFLTDVFLNSIYISLHILVQLQLIYTPLFLVSLTEQEKKSIGRTNERIISTSENDRADVI